MIFSFDWLSEANIHLAPLADISDSNEAYRKLMVYTCYLYDAPHN
jgi:hypothetical protein